MHSALSFVLVAALALCAQAAPTPLKSLQKRTFAVSVKPRFGAAHDPSNEISRAYGKYGWKNIAVNPEDPSGSVFGDSLPGVHSSPFTEGPSFAPAASSNAGSGTTSSSNSDAAAGSSSNSVVAAAVSSSGTSSGGSQEATVTATPKTGNSEYLSPVSIGGQQLDLDFDTGSSDLWVFSTEMPSNEIGQHATFNPAKSSSWSVLNGYSWQIQYGDKSTASGSVGTDTVNIGGATVTKQAVEIATSVSGSFVRDTANDGLLGLGFSNINTVQPQAQKTWFENIKGQLQQPVFTADLGNNSPGTYEFGVIDSSKYTGDIHFTTVDTSSGFWQISSPSYSIAGSSSQCSTCSPAIADTGTSLMIMDDDIVKAYYQQVNGVQFQANQGGYTFACGTTLPDFGVAIGSDYVATVKGSAMTYAQVSQGTCMGALQSNNGNGLQILGDAFLKNYFAVFDAGNNSFGVATKA